MSEFSEQASSIVRQIAHTLATKGLSFGCRAALVVILGKSLAPAGYGAYSLILTVDAFAVVIVGLSLNSYVYRAVPGLDPVEQLRIFKATFLFELAAVIVVVAGILLLGGLAPLVAFFNAGGYETAFAAGMLLLVLLVALGEVSHFLMARKQIEAANWIDFLSQAAWILPLGLAWWAGLFASPTVVILWQAAGCLVALLAGIFVIGARDLWRAAPKWAAIATAVAFSAPLIVESLTVEAIRLADRSVLSHAHGLSAVGVYGFGFTFINTLYTFSAWAIFKTFGPRIFAAHNTGEVEKRDVLMTYMVKISVLAFSAGVVFLLVFAGPIIRAFARPGYLDSIRLIPVLGVAFIMMIVSLPAQLRLLMQNRVTTVLWIDLSAVAVAILLDLLLIPRWSYMGAAAASLAAYSAVAIAKYSVSDTRAMLRPSILFSFHEELRLVRRLVRS